jgi:hypothetical protein
VSFAAEETFANAFATTLAANGGTVTSGATSFNLASLAGAPVASSSSTPTQGFRAIIDGDTPGPNTEIVWVLDASGSTINTCVRAAESYPGGCPAGSPVAHSDGVPFRAILTADSFVAFQSSGGGGGGGGLVGPLEPGSTIKVLADVDLITTGPLDPHTYSNVGGGTSGVGDTLTSTGNQALIIDGIACTVGQRILVSSVANGSGGSTTWPTNAWGAAGATQQIFDGIGYDTFLGIYTVTQVGSGSTPWIMTRATDCDTAAVMGSYWMTKTSTANLGIGGSYCVALSTPYMYDPATGFVFDSDDTDISVWAGQPNSNGNAYSIAAPGSQAHGFTSVALADGSFIDQNSANSIAGSNALAFAPNALALGARSWVGRQATYAAAIAALGGAYSEGQLVKTASIAGQTSEVSAAVALAAAGTGPLVQFDNAAWLLAMLNANGGEVWNKTLAVHIDIVVRVESTNDSGWFTVDGLIKGDGVSGYSWVGGTAPTPTLKIGDASMSAWAFTVSIIAGPVGGPAKVLSVSVTASDPTNASHVVANANIVEALS